MLTWVKGQGGKQTSPWGPKEAVARRTEDTRYRGSGQPGDCKWRQRLGQQMGQDRSRSWVKFIPEREGSKLQVVY